MQQNNARIIFARNFLCTTLCARELLRIPRAFLCTGILVHNLACTRAIVHFSRMFMHDNSCAHPCVRDKFCAFFVHLYAR